MSLARLFAVALFVLPACYTPRGVFTARSVTSRVSPICSEAVEMGPDDVRTVMDAGGTMTGDLECDLDDCISYVEVALNGGTHYYVRSKRGSSSTSRGVAAIDVYRLPKADWRGLPAGLRPKE